MELDMKIEAVLFYKAAPISVHTLATFFGVSEDDIRAACATLSDRLLGGATRLAMTDTEAVLVTAPELSETIETLRKDDMKRDIGKAGAETLAIILYRGPLSRADIDRIRGVNSTFILRNLLIRGLIERRAHPTDTRSFHYAVTPALLAHLGITRREELPEFSEMMDALEIFEKQQTEQEAGEDRTSTFKEQVENQ